MTFDRNDPPTTPSVKRLLADSDSVVRRQGLYRVVSEFQYVILRAARSVTSTVEQAMDAAQEFCCGVLAGDVQFDVERYQVRQTLCARLAYQQKERRRRELRHQHFVGRLQVHFEQLRADSGSTPAETKDAAQLHDRCVSRLKERAAQRGELAAFEVLEPFLVSNPCSDLELARRLGKRVGAAKAEKKRFRQRYDELLTKELVRLGLRDLTRGLEQRLKVARR
jgi:DNA-directed RNA polymerase specialized sigma24 family protein